ncbi:MAG: M1 family metallopeptidase [Bacteroidia bacterium]
MRTPLPKSLSKGEGLVLLIVIMLSPLFWRGAGGEVFGQKTYFQQQVDYTIHVKLNDIKHTLSANETIVYQNNSRDTLRFIYFHLWANAYKDNSTALAKQFLQQGNRSLYFAKQEDRGYIDSLDFRADDQSLKMEYDKENLDICKVFLLKPLAPSQSITITTPFKVKIPSAAFSRLGHDKQAYYVSQWYPKPAVYDAHGWNQMPYLDQGEFYSEFGSFDVSITLPKNYVLAATGDRYDNEAEETFLNQKIIATEKKIKTMDGASFKKDMLFPKSDAEFKTVRFKQEKVHDFAWFADKRFNVLRGELILPHTKNSVTTWTFFTDKNIDLWKDALGYISDATYYYSLWNGDYAYNNVSAVDGTIAAGGGMEYPNITVIGEASNAFDLDVVITHEVGHNWFYGMLGSNERALAWMDEGINSFNELRYVQTKYPNATLATLLGRDSTFWLMHINKYKQCYSYYWLYAMSAKQGADQPCSLPSEDFTQMNYAAIVYSKTAILFNYLKDYMGENDFDIAMQFYFNQCKFKHPSPKDLQKTLEYFSEKKLDWFFTDLISTTKKLDYKVTKQKKLLDGSYEVTVKNVGDIEGPVALQGLYDKEVKGMVWYDGFKGSKKLLFPPAEITSFKIDYNEIMPEVNRKNNTIRTHGIFKKLEPLKPELIAAIDNPNKTQLFFSPIMGYNMYNGYMLGMAYYNHALFEKKFETEIAPMYSFGNKDITGIANARLNLHPKRVFSTINIGFKAQRFAYDDHDAFTDNYNKFAPYINLDFKKKHATSLLQHRVTYRYVEIMKQVTGYNLDGNAAQLNLNYGVHDFLYQFVNNNALYPTLVKVNGQANADMQKASVTIVQKLFVSRTHFFEVRAFAGMMNQNQNSLVDYRFRMSGWRGDKDYMYDNLYFGRSETNGLAAAQFIESDGAFKVYTGLGQTANWLVSLNIKSPKIFKLPLLFYADIGTCAPDGLALPNQNLFYNAGIDIVIVRDIFEIFVPLVISQNILDNNKLNGVNNNLFQQIRFVLNLNKVNPFTLIKQASSF